MQARSRIERLMVAAVIAMAALSLMAAVARAWLLLFVPPGFLDAWIERVFRVRDAGDVRYYQHFRLTMLHVVPGIVFAVLGPLQFVRRIRARWPGLHRWSGRLFVGAAILVGINGLGLGFTTGLQYGGIAELAPIAVMSPIFLFSLARAVVYARRRQFAEHREWMIRAFAIGLAAGSTRTVGFVFALNATYRAAPRLAIGPIFWVGFLVSFLAGELWIHRTRPALKAQAASTGGFSSG